MRRRDGIFGQDTYVDHVIETTVLRNRDKHRLVVSSRVDRRQAVGSRRETTSDVGGESAVLGGIVETLEERELLRVRDRRLLERVEEVDDDVRVALDVAVRLDDLRRREVVLVRVHEETSLKVVDVHGNRERRVLVDDRAVSREDELRRRHVALRGDDTHRRGVAGAGRDLLAVGDREVGNSQAEVDEVVARGERRNLTSRRLVLTVVLKARCDHLGVESCEGIIVSRHGGWCP